MFLLLLVLCCQYKRACYSICVYKYTGYMLLSVLTSFIFQLINIFIMIIELIKHQWWVQYQQAVNVLIINTQPSIAF